jgi:hypothetical protein
MVAMAATVTIARRSVLLRDVNMVYLPVGQLPARVVGDTMTR